MTDLVALLKGAEEHIKASEEILEQPGLKGVPGELVQLHIRIKNLGNEIRSRKIAAMSVLTGIVSAIDPKISYRLKNGTHVTHSGSVFLKLAEEYISPRDLVDKHSGVFWEIADLLLERIARYFKEVPPAQRRGTEEIAAFLEKARAKLEP
jgi:hypothetical protein